MVLLWLTNMSPAPADEPCQIETNGFLSCQVQKLAAVDRGLALLPWQYDASDTCQYGVRIDKERFIYLSVQE